MNTKLHAVADAKGRPIGFFMSAGQVSDYTGAAALLGKARATAERDMDRAKAAIERLQKSLIAGRVDEEFFDREIISLRQDLAAAQERLAAAPDAQIISLPDGGGPR